MGMCKEKLQAVIKSSALFSIVPSIAIVAGLASLVVVIGLPYGWFRLSVLGSVAYEIMAADMALSALNLDVATANAEAFGLMAWGNVHWYYSNTDFQSVFMQKNSPWKYKTGRR